MQQHDTTFVDNDVQVCTDSRETSAPPILCVDLDDTLLATDVLWESILLLSKHQPWAMLMLPIWALRGRAFLKRRLAERVILDPGTLPFRQDVLAYLKQEHRQGRTLVLATGSDYQPAEAIASHLGLFSEVLASNSRINLTGTQKSQKLIERFGERGFDYIGDNKKDLLIWAHARAALLVDPTRWLIPQASQSCSVIKIFHKPTRPVQSLVRALRIGQWVKNILIFLPLLASHQFEHWEQSTQAVWAFLSFSLCASSLYILNDLLDLPADRRHPKKRERPFASGDLSIPYGFLMIPTLGFGAVLLAYVSLPNSFLSLIGLYAITTTGYSLFLKQVAILDVLILAGLYTIRVLAGGLAIGVSISSWLLAFSMFFFLSLAFTKRYLELQYRKVRHHQGLERRAYQGLDKHILSIMGIVSGYLSVLVFALYINSPDVFALYQRPKILWLACPLLVYWISRNWLLANRGALDDDPLILAIKDPASYFVAIAGGLIVLVAI
ncbi:MAG: membrane protein [Nitrospirales bacterium]|nr:MAG: membrane protein [Nitrospirales bacterium]